MKDLYYSKGDLDRIIELADIILQKKDTLEPGVLQDIWYYLCLSLAKKRDERLVKEVQNIRGDEHSFLLGFYYRNCGRYEEALHRFESIVDAKYVSARAKREIVQVYVALEEFDKALEYAKNNYEENRGNQFHAQAYFNCLINSENPENYADTLLALIDNLRGIDSEQSVEMADIAESLYHAKALNDRTVALDKIWDCVHRYRGNHYPLLALCDIAIRFRDESVLNQGLEELQELSRKRHVSQRTVNRYKAYMHALKGDSEGAVSIIENDLARHPRESKERVLARLRAYSQD